jgi:hypothetical protein
MRRLQLIKFHHPDQWQDSRRTAPTTGHGP